MQPTVDFILFPTELVRQFFPRRFRAQAAPSLLCVKGGGPPLVVEGLANYSISN